MGICMRQNSTDYSGERAPRRQCVIAQAGYTGQNYYAVAYRNQSITVRAGDELAAIFTAAKYWGYKWSAPEYHQNAKAMKLHYKPEMVG